MGRVVDWDPGDALEAVRGVEPVAVVVVVSDEYGVIVRVRLDGVQDGRVHDGGHVGVLWSFPVGVSRRAGGEDAYVIGERYKQRERASGRYESSSSSRSSIRSGASSTSRSITEITGQYISIEC